MIKEVFAPHLGHNVKFGRVRPRVIHPHLRLSNYLKASLPAAPSTCDYSAAASSALANVYLNDTLGDCVIAGGYHVTGVETGNAGDLFIASTAQITADYSAIGGYVPGDPSTDQGCNLQTALAYWTQHGFANGTKLLGYLAVNPANQAEVMAACYLFENLYLGLELPDTYVNPFPSSNGFVWGPGTPDPNNGHCIMSFGYNSQGIMIGTWGMKGIMTWPAVQSLLSSADGGELYVMFSPDQLAKAQSKAPNGVAWTSLISDWDSIGGTVPQPAPAPPPPAPTPTTAPSLAAAQAAVTHALNIVPPIMLRKTAISVATQALVPLWPKGTP